MAGELTHIIPTHPSDPQFKASRTKGITWCDSNGVAHTITAVYWSPTNNVNDRKLIWQLNNYVPYDNSCIAIISLTANGKGWVVTVEKDGEDVTSSFASMIPWIYNANNVRFNPKVRISSNTVDLSSFERGEYRLDVSQITSKVGASSYFPSSGVVSAPDHVYIGGGNNLVAGNQNVAIEYDLTNALYPVTVNSIEIFTDSSSNSSAKIKILHESGLFIAAVDGDTKGTQEERFGLNGYSHSVDNLSVYLEKGHKYYIVYQGSTNEAFYPSRFQNENGKYKVYANTTTASQITPATSSDLSSIGTFKGNIGTGDITQEIRAQLMSFNTNESFCWTGWNKTFITLELINGSFYKRISKTYNYSHITDITDDTKSYQYKFAKLLGDIKIYTGVIQNGYIRSYFPYSYDIILMNTGWTSYIDMLNDEPVSLSERPSNPSKGLYFINNEVQVYDGSAWSRPFEHDMNESLIENYVKYPDWSTDFQKLNITGTVAGTSFTDASLNTDKHFYLKINGMEV